MTREREVKDAHRRLTTPEAEQWIGRKIPCLDHGFIYLVDYMGGDASIVQAARVSYGLGTKSVSEDRGLIRYLMRHQHTTPFEMVELKFHVKLPIFVARQWIRHRTACVTGDAGLIFDLPGAERRGRRQYYRVTIENLHRLWHEGTTHPIRKRKGSSSQSDPLRGTRGEDSRAHLAYTSLPVRARQRLARVRDAELPSPGADA